MSLREELKNTDIKYWENSRVKIKPLTTQDDLIYAGYECQLDEEQSKFISPFWFTIGRAYLNKDDNYPCIIYNKNNEPIGFINLCVWFGSGDAYSWSFYIDKRYQGKGYGKSAGQLAIGILKAANISKMIKLATEQSNDRAQSLYSSLGFKQLDETDGDDLVFGL